MTELTEHQIIHLFSIEVASLGPFSQGGKLTMWIILLFLYTREQKNLLGTWTA